MTPEELQRRRLEALRAAGADAPSSLPPQQPPPAPGRPHPDALRQAAPQQPQPAVPHTPPAGPPREPAGPGAYTPPADAPAEPAAPRGGLVDPESSGSTHHRPAKAVEFRRSESYGPRSKAAISVINKFFASTNCSELHFNAPDRLFAKVAGERVRLRAEEGGPPLAFDSEEDYNRFIEEMLIDRAETTKTIDDIRRRARDVVRMAGGDRMAILMPPFTEHTAVAIHKVVARSWQMDRLIDNGTLTEDMAHFLIAAVRAKCNILICGAMGSGKSVLLSLLAQQIGEADRMALIEEVPEIFLDKADALPVTYFPNSVTDEPMGLPEVIDTLLYFREDRLIVGEIHGAGMSDMLRAMSTGGDGSMSTFHAGNVEQALSQVRNFVLEEKPNIPVFVAAEKVRNAIDLVVIVKRVYGRHHRVTEIAEVEWRGRTDEARVAFSPIYKFNVASPEEVAQGHIGEFLRWSPPDPRGRVREKARDEGIIMPDAWFGNDSVNHHGQD